MVAIPVVAVALAVGAIATPAWADCSPTDHCYGTGTYDGSNNTRQGVSSDVEIFDHSINSGFTENDVNMFLDSSDWMVAGYVVGSPAPCGGSTSVPRGCVEWDDGGHSDNSGFD